MVKYVNSDTFNKCIDKENSLCLVDFFASWCGPCMMLSPILDEIGNSRTTCDILKVDVDKCPDIATRLKIDTIPTICIYKDGKLVDKQIGFKNKEEITTLIQKFS